MSLTNFIVVYAQVFIRFLHKLIRVHFELFLYFILASDETALHQTNDILVQSFEHFVVNLTHQTVHTRL